MKLVDRARVDIRLGEYGVAPATALADVALLSRVQEYRRLIGSRIMAIGKEDIRARVPAGPSHVSRKVDGEFTVLAVDGDEAFTLNPGGTVRIGLPFLAEAQRLVEAAGRARVLVCGELYVVRADGGRARIHDVVDREVRRVAWGSSAVRAQVEAGLDRIDAGEGTPYSVAEEIIGLVLR